LDSFDGSGLQQGPGESLRAAWEQHDIELLLDAASSSLPDEERRELAARVASVKERIERGEIDLAFEAIERVRDVPCVPPGDDDEPPNHGWRWRLQLGLEFVTTSTAAWRSRYPHLASWPGSRSSWGTHGDLTLISLGFSCDSHRTWYTVIKKEVSAGGRRDIYQAWDDAIKEWKDQKDPEEIERLARGWMGEAGWEARYPHLASWIGRGTTHGVHIDIDLVDHTSSIEEWLYDKPSKTKTVLIERRMDAASEDEVLSALDAAIGAWVSASGNATPPQS
jgi:hypothetical protein